MKCKKSGGECAPRSGRHFVRRPMQLWPRCRALALLSAALAVPNIDCFHSKAGGASDSSRPTSAHATLSLAALPFTGLANAFSQGSYGEVPSQNMPSPWFLALGARTSRRGSPALEIRYPLTFGGLLLLFVPCSVKIAWMWKQGKLGSQDAEQPSEEFVDAREFEGNIEEPCNPLPLDGASNVGPQRYARTPKKDTPSRLQLFLSMKFCPSRRRQG